MQIFSTRMSNATAHWLMALEAGGPRGNSAVIAICSVSYLSFIYGSTGGIYGPSFSFLEILIIKKLFNFKVYLI